MWKREKGTELQAIESTHKPLLFKRNMFSVRCFCHLFSVHELLTATLNECVYVLLHRTHTLHSMNIEFYSVVAFKFLVNIEFVITRSVAKQWHDMKRKTHTEREKWIIMLFVDSECVGGTWNCFQIKMQPWNSSLNFQNSKSIKYFIMLLGYDGQKKIITLLKNQQKGKKRSRRREYWKNEVNTLVRSDVVR